MKEQKPHKLQINNHVKNVHFLEKYRYYVKGRKKLFDKE